MSAIDIQFLESELIGTTVPVPVSGTLSGHAAGEPFDKHAYRFLKHRYPDSTYRQFEYLNKIYRENPSAVSFLDRWNLIQPASLAYLLNRGKEATIQWNESNVFVEKQNDTADIIITDKDFFHLIDVKTFNFLKNGQPPNIISAYKVAKMCAIMIRENNFKSHKISYVGISWELDSEHLRCTRASVKELFKTNPQKLYINWAAAMQIQFHVELLDQTYEKTTEQWCHEYLQQFTNQARSRANTMIQKFVSPFEDLA